MLLTKTTEIAIQCLVMLARLPKGTLITPGPISDALNSSMSYTSKILRNLAKADLLTSHRGASGGFSMSREPENITLLEVVEACEGTIVGNYCREFSGAGSIAKTCGYHQAMFEFQEGVKDLLKKWTVAEIARRPLSKKHDAPDCKLRRILESDPNQVMRRKGSSK